MHVRLALLGGALTSYLAIAAPLNIRHSAQVGFEFDSNVYRTFQAEKHDVLLRALAKQKGMFTFLEGQRVGWLYQIGGKKYFEAQGQDTLIQTLDIPLMLSVAPGVDLNFTQDLKYQLEDGRIDAGSNDINEDYFAYQARLAPRLFPMQWQGVRLEPSVSFSYFEFFPAKNFSFTRQTLGLRADYALTPSISVFTSYGFGMQQFFSNTRDDEDHQVSVGVSHLGPIYMSLGYTFEANESSRPEFSFDRHQIATVLSYTFGKIGTTSESEEAKARYAVHLLGTLQLRSLPAIYDFDAEGQRFLLTGAEDENFNSLVLKFTCHPTPWFALESKLTRYSNEFSAVQGNFSRVMAYIGLRGDF